MNLLYVDTNIFIYLLEQHGTFSQKAADILQAHADADSQLVTSAITVTEFLAGTTKSTLSTLQRVPRLNIMNLDEAIAEKAALLQRESNLSIGDAIHVATALRVRASHLFTNDKQLAKAAQPFISIKSL